MITNIPILDALIGLIFVVSGIYLARAKYKDHQFEGKTTKWTEWDAGSINTFLSGIMAFFLGLFITIASVLDLF